MIRLSKSIIDQSDKDAVLDILDKGYLGMGPEVASFENNLKEFIQTKKDVTCVNSGTAAIHIALEALGIKKGDEVLVPTITYVATYQAISATGATPVSCDILPNNLFIDIKDAEKKITSKTKAIIPVHYASDSQLMNDVYRFAENYKLRVIEDAAHSFGSYRNNKLIGVEGDIICFSFDGIKNITSGEGGAILTEDPKVIKKIKDIRLLGVEKDTNNRFEKKRSWDFDVEEQGYRYHMSDMMAALGNSQLKKVHKFRKKRQEIVSTYLNSLNKSSYIEFLDLDYKNIMPHIFVIRLKNNKRPFLISKFKENNIQYGIHYKPNHLLKKYYCKNEFPEAMSAYNEIISLPCHPDLSNENLQKILEYLCR